ncbi:MAG: phage head morphogenesis protein, partial [Kangiella sp.]|nr:phage head morphogenesis protein [Kangiella sp.]
MPTQYGSLPFLEAIQFFRGKLNIPTEHWTDLWQGQHSKGFMIAGAVKSDLLSDFRQAVDKAISEGTTLADFRKDFDRIVKKHGWQYNGGRGWRSRVIYDTNIRQAYNAGRWDQIQRIKNRRPYLLYRHGGSANPRPMHLSWDGLVLPVDDPWWDTHMPQNGWGCSCKVFSLSESDLVRRGLKVDQAPDNGSYEWANPNTGEKHRVPNGIDPGFAHNV